MSNLFEVLSGDEAKEAEASRGSHGLYKEVLSAFVDSGARSARIRVEGEGANPNFTGMKAQNVKTGLDSARKADGAPDSYKEIKVKQAKGVIFLVNQAVDPA